MSKHSASVVIVSMLLTGCTARLQVRVDVYDGPIPVTIQEASNLAVAVLNDPTFDPNDPKTRRKAFDGLLEELKKNLEGLEAAPPAPPAAPADPPTPPATMTDPAAPPSAPADPPTPPATMRESDAFDQNWIGIESSLRRDWSKVVKAADAGRAAAETLNASLPVGKNQQLDDEAGKAHAALQVALERYLKKRNDFLHFVDESLGPFLIDLDPGELDRILGGFRAGLPRAGVDSTRALASSDELDGRSVGYPLFDPVVAKIIQTGEENASCDGPCWVRFVDNTFRTKGGNAQFVVVSEGLIVFHQKSLDFDPTPVIGAGKAVAKLGVKISAALASGMATGVPTTGGAPGKGEDAGAATGAGVNQLVDLAALQADRETLARRTDAANFLLQRLADLIDRAHDHNSDLKAIISDLHTYVGHYQGRLQ